MAQDNGAPALSVNAMATINLTDINESPAMGDQVFSINENVPTGTFAGSMNATDPDRKNGQTLTYSITAGNTGGAFAISPSTGVITVNNPAAVNFLKSIRSSS
ncbi:MAG: cadherin repeat domain-containing protein [Lentimicrobium sp.]|uniref:cadherin repeat domain-containing protein n=1 Tax=Lentimicrobium sp. TaxID=2034841 RepID=UPI0025D331F4|nr:cadherin repeat domain-containing protein [Lentimicrobium sp.]MCO5255944.1 cadherin repeat domain-containing protein [Lentimicrobium sp.]